MSALWCQVISMKNFLIMITNICHCKTAKKLGKAFKKEFVNNRPKIPLLTSVSRSPMELPEGPGYKRTGVYKVWKKVVSLFSETKDKSPEEIAKHFKSREYTSVHDNNNIRSSTIEVAHLDTV